MDRYLRLVVYYIHKSYKDIVTKQEVACISGTVKWNETDKTLGPMWS